MSRPSMEAIQACISKIRTIGILATTMRKDIEEAPFLSSDAERVRNLTARYEETRQWISMRFYEIGGQMPHISYPKSMSDRKGPGSVVEDVLIGCSTAERGLDALLKPSVEPDVADRLGSLMKELKRFENKGLDLSMINNLRTAIAEAENGHYLASAMISSRAIQYIVDKIPGETDEEKTKFLVDKSITPADRKDEQKQIISAMRLSRNFLSHRIDLFPDPANVLMLLGGAFSLSKVLMSLPTR